MKDIMDKADKFRNDKEVIEEYDYEKMRDEREEMAFIEGIQEGIEQGVQEGIQQRNIDIAKNMLNLNIDIETISKVTNLTKTEIEKLKNN